MESDKVWKFSALFCGEKPQQVCRGVHHNAHQSRAGAGVWGYGPNLCKKFHLKVRVSQQRQSLGEKKSLEKRVTKFPSTYQGLQRSARLQVTSETSAWTNPTFFQ